ncbi:glycoside hydrolase family 53 protein [Aquimarina mytili]|uniref:Arabinogalactan endo-beta-1,4-galactanase n=1 Tax=Aquimarina mytili TaxID=874423 RepID=A0A936ZTK7_9FLAO|nr:glycosyl hydrolase 53 family protein [Aquimarina mytili]MBL0685172.1 glycosyl hydrolase 53 family protein [Aquimarina mytili]
MKKTATSFLWLLLCIGCSGDDVKPEEAINLNPIEEKTFYTGMDLSFQSELQSYNLNYNDQEGNPVDILEYVTSKGTNLIRLRLWHTPENGINSLEKVKEYALKIKSKNADFLLDIHYSDTWADPGNQIPPKSWNTMTNSEIKNAVYNYTKQVIQELKNQGTPPSFVQIGNETNSGFLWNYGKVWDEFVDNWSFYVMLSNEAYAAIKEVDSTIKTMIHVAGFKDAKLFFEKFEENKGNYDIIGLSYYPQFHGKDLTDFQNNINDLATTYNKDILLTEISYPFTFDWNDNQTNFIGQKDQILSRFPATPDGQKEYLKWIVNVLKNIPNNHGIGFCYWAPDWIAFTGNENTSTNGSSWENQCLFDFNFNALPAIEVFTNN